MKVKKSYMQIQIIDALIADYLTKNGYLVDKKYTDKDRTAFASASINVLNQIAKHIHTLNEEIDNLRIKNCAIDPVTKVQLKGSVDKFGNPTRQYTIDGELQLKKDLKELMSVEVELHARIVKKGDLDFEPTEDEIEAFAGILLETIEEK